MSDQHLKLDSLSKFNILTGIMQSFHSKPFFRVTNIFFLAKTGLVAILLLSANVWTDNSLKLIDPQSELSDQSEPLYCEPDDTGCFRQERTQPNEHYFLIKIPRPALHFEMIDPNSSDVQANRVLSPSAIQYAMIRNQRASQLKIANRFGKRSTLRISNRFGRG